MLNRKSLVGSLTAFVLVVSQIGTAVAVDVADTQKVSAANTSQSSQVTLAVEEDTRVFSAIIPAVIPSTVDKNGTVQVPSNISIVNENADNPIKVTSIAVTPQGAWSIKDYNTGPSSLTDAQEYAMSLNSDIVESDGSVTLTEANWKVAAGGKLPISLGLKVSPQASSQNLGTIANISFTLDWDSTAVETPGQETEPTADQVVLRFEVNSTSPYANLSGGTYKVINKSDLVNGWTPPFPTVEPYLGYEFAQWIYTSSDGATYASGPYDWQELSVSTEMTYRAVINQKSYSKIKFIYHGAENTTMFLAPQAAGDTSSNPDLASATSGTLTYTVANAAGGFRILTPQVSRNSMVELDRWADFNTGETMYDYNTSQFSTWKLAREEDAGTTGVYELQLVTREAAAKYSNVTYLAGNYGKIKMPGNETSLVAQYNTKLKWNGGILSVSFPLLQVDSGKTFDRWVNTVDGSNALDGSNLTPVAIPGTTDDYSFTAVYKDQPSTTVYCYTDANCKIQSGSSTVILKPGQSGALPTIEYTSDFRFDGWYYKTTGAKIATDSSGMLMLDFEAAGATYDATKNMYYYSIVARCSKLAGRSAGIPYTETVQISTQDIDTGIQRAEYELSKLSGNDTVESDSKTVNYTRNTEYSTNS